MNIFSRFLGAQQPTPVNTTPVAGPAQISPIYLQQQAQQEAALAAQRPQVPTPINNQPPSMYQLPQQRTPIQAFLSDLAGGMSTMRYSPYDKYATFGAAFGGSAAGADRRRAEQFEMERDKNKEEYDRFDNERQAALNQAQERRLAESGRLRNRLDEITLEQKKRELELAKTRKGIREDHHEKAMNFAEKRLKQDSDDADPVNGVPVLTPEQKKQLFEQYYNDFLRGYGYDESQIGNPTNGNPNPDKLPPPEEGELGEGPNGEPVVWRNGRWENRQ